MGIAANIGNIAIQFIQPSLGWWGVFIFFGVLTCISTILLVFFNQRPNMPLLVKEEVDFKAAQKKAEKKALKK